MTVDPTPGARLSPRRRRRQDARLPRAGGARDDAFPKRGTSRLSRAAGPGAGTAPPARIDPPQLAPATPPSRPRPPDARRCAAPP
ncbi:MAG: hypothetical protein ACK52I_34015 [Pseudomonadota bacterium]